MIKKNAQTMRRDLNLKSLLKKQGWFYSYARMVYWKFMSLRAMLYGAGIEEKKWTSRNMMQARKSFENLGHPHRRFLLNEFKDMEPFSSVLEIGTGYGANLYWIWKRYGNVRLSGIDMDSASIKEGEKFFAGKKMTNFNLTVGKADIIERIPDKSYDIILTDAALIYIDPGKIMKIIKEMFRVARKSLIFCEWHDYAGNDPRGAGFYYRGCWVRNYANLCKYYVPEEKIKIKKIPDCAWPEKNWQKLGYLIKVSI
jgi:hypothetical protein